MDRKKPKECNWCTGTKHWLRLAKVWRCDNCGREMKDYKLKRR